MITILSGTQDTRNNGEDFALTPYLFGVKPNPNTFKTYGVGLCWGWWALFFSVSFKTDKGFPLFKWINNIKT